MTPLEIARQLLAARVPIPADGPIEDRILAALASGALAGSALRMRLGIGSAERDAFYQALVHLIAEGRLQTDPVSCTYYPSGEGP